MSTEFLTQFFGSSWLEWIGVVTALLGIWLSTRLHISSWILAIASSVIYGYVFYQVRLYADSGLQLLFIGLSVRGYFNWKKALPHSKIPHNDRMLIHTLPLRVLLLSTIICIVLSVVCGILLGRFTNDSMPLADGFCFAFSVWATYLAANLLIENWAVWLITDLVYVAMYIQKKLFATALLYGILCVLAVVGYIGWKKIQENAHSTSLVV